MKARFLTELVVSPVKGQDLLWRVDAPLSYEAGEGGGLMPQGGYQAVWVPRGFVTDFASIPRVFWRVILPTGRHREAAVVHDYLYYCGDRHKLVCDAIFLEAMLALGVPKLRAWVMFLAVALFGDGAWKAHRRAKHGARSAEHGGGK